LRAACRAARAIVLSVVSVLALADFALAQIELPAGSLSERIVVAADSGSHWTEGSYDVYLLRGNCYINQGLTYARSQEAVLWIERGGPGGEPPHKVIAYLEGDVEINYQQAGAGQKAAGAASITDKTWFCRFLSVQPVAGRPMKLEPPPAARPAVYDHAAARLAARRQRAAHPVCRAGARRRPSSVRQTACSASACRAAARRPDHRGVSVPNTGEAVLIIKSGVNIVVDGVDTFGSIDVDTDNPWSG
jgi:hypothetical protein